jgi:hypothetical protein
MFQAHAYVWPAIPACPSGQAGLKPFPRNAAGKWFSFGNQFSLITFNKSVTRIIKISYVKQGLLSWAGTRKQPSSPNGRKVK